MTAKTASRKSMTITPKEKNMTAKTTKTETVSDPKPTVRKTKKQAAAETIVPELTDAQKARLYSTAMGAVTRAIKAADAVEVTEDDRTLVRKNHLLEKVVAAKVTANERAAAAGKAQPFTTEDVTFKPIEREPMQESAAEEPEPEQPAAAVGFDVTLQNMSDGSVQGHRTGCADINKRRRNAKVQPGDEPWPLTVQHKHEAWVNYNSDFLAEGPESGQYNIDWLPCADGVPQGPSDDYATWLAEENSETTEPEPKEPFKAVAPKARKAAATTKAAATAKKGSGTTTAKEKAPRPTPADRSEQKANDLANYAQSVGWDAVLEPYGTNGFTATLRRGDEELGAKFIDGKLGLEPDERPYYKNAARPRPVLLRNVSAMRQQMDEDETKRPIARETTRVARSERADRPRKSFSWDDTLDDATLLDVLQTEMTGKRISWKVTLDGSTEEMERVIGKVAKVGRTPSNDRTVDFFEMEITKDGLMANSRHRTLTLKSILRLI
jgi:hypothetical protein